ncbi:MAG TPA: sigma-70 family RNA polymerase sigma factor [Trebonia sp.]
MGDREVVASIVAGDPAGLAIAYDRYAPALHAYCRSMLREPADAADAVQDTFVIAASRLRDLRDPDRLRPWLYAVARNVCLRKLREHKAAAEGAPALGTPPPRGPGRRADLSLAGEPPSAADPAEIPDPADVSDRAERAEFRALIHDASGGLTSRDREILRLRLWEELGPDEAGNVLGVSRAYANALFARAREQLTASLGDLLVARTGRADCAQLRQILENWNGQLTVLLRKRLSRHIERCATCSGRRRRELVPALLGLSPAVALSTVAVAEGARDTAGHVAGHAAGYAMSHAAWQAAQLPAALKTQTLAAAARHAGVTAAGAKAASPAGAFGRDGFPKPVHHGGAWVAHATRAPAATAGTAAAAIVVATVVALALTLPSGPKGHLAGGAPRTPSGPGTISPRHGARPGGGKSGRGPGGASSGSRGSRVAGAALAATSAPTGSVPGGPTTTGSSPTPPPTSTPPPTTSPGGPPSSAPPPPPPKSGTLTVSTTTVLLTPLLGNTITLTAHSGPVTWHISESSTLLGSLTLSRSSGTLEAGQSVQVTITVQGLASLDTTLLVEPAGTPINVLVGLGL